MESYRHCSAPLSTASSEPKSLKPFKGCASFWGGICVSLLCLHIAYNVFLLLSHRFLSARVPQVLEVKPGFYVELCPLAETRTLCVSCFQS